MAIFGYLRVSTTRQELENQRREILEWAHRQKAIVDDFVEVEASSRRSMKDRRLDELMGKMSNGDLLVVSELSRLGRSLGQIVQLIEGLIRGGIDLQTIKEGIRLNGEQDIGTKAQIALFGLLAELERDLISERTKAGLSRARAQGKRIGRPPGAIGVSMLDGKEAEIENLLGLGVTRANIARIVGCSWPTVNSFIKSRGLGTFR